MTELKVKYGVVSGEQPQPHDDFAVGPPMTPGDVEAGTDVPGGQWVYGYPNKPCVPKKPVFGMMYDNPDDPRCCVMGYQCNTESAACLGPAPNFATSGGKACYVVSFLSAFIIGFVLAFVAFSKKGGE